MKLPVNFIVSQGVPKLVWVLFAFLFVYGLLSVNPLLSTLAALLFIIFFLLLWRPGEPPIMLLILGIQWLQVVTKIYKADIMGLSIDGLNAYGGNNEKAIILSMMSLVVLALGIRLAIHKYKLSDQVVIRQQSTNLSVKRLWLFYIGYVAFSIFMIYGSRIIPGLTQIIIVMAKLKWAVYFVFAYVCFSRATNLWLLFIAFCIELAFGLGAYFSSFREVFLITILAYVASGRKLALKQFSILLIMMGILIYFSLLWTAIKVEYRYYISGGTQAQIVVRSYGDRVVKLLDMVEAVDKEMALAADQLTERISYVDYFGRALVMVPDRLPHTGGEIWLSALKHILMPRLLFPDKAEVGNDSLFTRRYTGLNMAGAERGTNISIGYMAESYIDLGQYFMFIPIFLLGLLVGKMFKYITSINKYPGIISYGLGIVVVSCVSQVETPVIKILGSLVTSFIVVFIVQKYFVMKLLRRLYIRQLSLAQRVMN